MPRSASQVGALIFIQMNTKMLATWLQEDERNLELALFEISDHIEKNKLTHQVRISEKGVTFQGYPIVPLLSIEWSAHLLEMVMGDILNYMEDEPDVNAPQWYSIQETFNSIEAQPIYLHRAEFNIPVSVVVSSRNPVLTIPDCGQRTFDLIRDHIVPDAIEVETHEITRPDINDLVDFDEFEF